MSRVESSREVLLKKTNYRHGALLRVHPKRPCRCCANKADELAPSHCLPQRAQDAPTIAYRRGRLQQGFSSGEMGFRGQFAWQQSRATDVCFGSKADIGARPGNV